MSDLQRVFIHEIGHLVAAELNYRLYNYDRRIEKLTLYPRNSTAFFNGEVYTSKANKDKYFVETCANEYVQTFYGCLFEVIYRKLELNKCLCYRFTKEKNVEHLKENLYNGVADAHQLNYIGARKELNKISSLWHDYTHDIYITEMNSLVNHFDMVFEMDINDFILEKLEYNGYSINIEKLVSSLNSFLDLHSPFYKSLLEKLYDIQNIKNQK